MFARTFYKMFEEYKVENFALFEDDLFFGVTSFLVCGYCDIYSIIIKIN
jgi:hypothetical protein